MTMPQRQAGKDTSKQMAALLYVRTIALFAACGLASCAADHSPVQVELRGATKTWTETDPVMETYDDARFQTERYGKRFSYVLRGVPPGPARLKLGFCEFKCKQPGKRVFDVLANGRALFKDFDILAWGAPLEAVVVAGNVSVPEDGPLVIEFVAKAENAKFNYLKLYTQKWAVEIQAGDGPEIELGKPSKDAPYMHEAYETCIGKFGSRICINPRPQRGICRQTPLGHADYNVAYFERNPALYDDPVAAVYYAVRAEGGKLGGRALESAPTRATTASPPAPLRSGEGRTANGGRALESAPTEPDGRGDVWYSLPFNGRIPAFTQIKQRQTLTSLSYTCRGPDLPLEVTYAFHAPFYPQDLKLCVAPYILLDVTVRNLTARQQAGTVAVGQSLVAAEGLRKVSERGCLGVVFEMPIFGKQTRQAWLVDESSAEGVTAHAGTLAIPATAEYDAPETRDQDGRVVLAARWADAASGLAWDFTLGPRAKATRTFAYVGWAPDPIIEVRREPYRFKYVDLFSDMFDVARFAFDNREQIDRKVALFESTVYDASAPQALKEFLAFAFQSWVQNTFYCASKPQREEADATLRQGSGQASRVPTDDSRTRWDRVPTEGAEGQDWFSVWEGCCKFHSTVDVEYNVAPLYFEYWPELMKMTLRQWVNYIRNGVLSHDMGMGLEANGMKYGHDMEVEENTNFVLLLHQYWRQTGDTELVEELFPYVDELLGHVTRCDTDGDGFHEEGTYNTIDQGSAAVQYAKDQTYLAVRALCAYECGALMAEQVGNDDRPDRWRDLAAVIARTLDVEAWLKDHYVVSLNQPPKQEARPETPAVGGNPGGDQGRGAEGDTWVNDGGWNNPNQPQGQSRDTYSQPSRYTPAKGWDGYSIYATNGMLYPMRSGCEIPGVNLRRMRTDLYTSTIATLKKYGSPHTNRESNMWVSQNIWRDMAAAYLGIDFSDNIERYWNLQKYINREKRGCFTDVYVYGSDHISLDYYPRGTAAFGLIPALAGLQVDKVAGKVSVAPLRAPLRIPLLAYADWEAGTVPWLTIIAEAGGVGVGVEGEVPVDVRTRALGMPW